MGQMVNRIKLVNAGGKPTAISDGCWMIWWPENKTIGFFEKNGERIYFSHGRNKRDDKRYFPEIADKDALIAKIVEPLANRYGLAWKLTSKFDPQHPERPMSFVFHGQ